MTPELWQRLKPLYNAAVEMPKESRAQFVASACKNDNELRAELEALLAAGNQSTDSLDAPILNLHDLYPTRKQAFHEGDVLLRRFRIVRLLGYGGMGEVYEAEDARLQKVHIALKTIRPDKAGDDDLRVRFEREVLLARELNHPNLCPMYDLFEYDEPASGFLFLTMKLLPGCTLAERLRVAAPIPPEEGMTVLARMAHGLAAIHAAGIVHRDIKPNNVMLDGTGQTMRLWITDFGLARAYQNETTLSGKRTLAGTPGYIAPELYVGDTPSQASDLFAFGVLMHEVFTGEKPAPAANGAAYIVSTRLAPPNVPASCVKLISECLSHDPQRRCEAFGEALEALDSKINRHQYAPRSGTSWTRRRFASTAAAGICVLGGGAWWKWDDFENTLHPLPQKRFVALLNWPKGSNARLAPMLTGALGAIKSELSRLEAFDRDLFVISPEDVGTEVEQIATLKDTCDALGANLVLAASALSPGRSP